MGGTEAEIIASLLHSFFEELEGEVEVFKEKIVLEVTVVEIGVWIVNCNGSTGTVHFAKTKPAGHPAGDCTITVDKVETIQGLLSGTLKPTSAFLTRKVKYSGNLKKAQLLRVPGRRAAERVVEDHGHVTLGGKTLQELAQLGSKANKSTLSAASSEEADAFFELEEVSFLNKYNAAWANDADVSSCSLCRTSFGVFRRKHHCRVCGRVCCDSCSGQRIRNKRVCTVCFQETVLRPGLDDSISTNRSRSLHQDVGTSKCEPEQFVQRLEEERFQVVDAESVDSRSWRLVEASRKLLLKSRELSTKVIELTPKSWSSRIAGLASIVGQKILFIAPYVLAWVRLGWLIKNNDVSTFGASLALSFVVATSKQVRSNLLGIVIGGCISLYPSFTASEIPFIGAWTVLSRLRSASNGFLLIPALVITVANWLFGRLFQIYFVAGVLIWCYWVTRKVCVNVLRLSPSRMRRVFASLDAVLAPIACNQILQLKSVFVKFGQYIGSRADLIPPVWNATLAKLQDDMPADPPGYVQRTVERAFGEELWDIFEDFNFKPLASASVAQVHEARLRLSDGSTCKVAVKVQHHGIARIMMSDFSAFSRIIRFIAWLNPDFEVAQVFLRAWKSEMLKELDFRIEADNILTVRKNLRSVGLVRDDDDDYTDDAYTGSKIVVPRVIKQFVERECFLMSFVPGFKITDKDQLELYGVDNRALCTRIVQAYAIQLYLDGVFNADPHPGNLFVTVDKSGEVRPVLLDFGMVVRLQDKERLGYCKLLNSIAQLTVSGVAEAIKQVGYQNSQSELHPLRDMEFFAHLLRDTADRKTSRKRSKQFRAQRKAQRKADLAEDSNSQGRFFKEFPDSLIFLFRVLGLIRGLCTILNVEISYIEIMGDYARLGLLMENRKPDVKVPKPLRAPSPLPDLERRLRGMVRQGDQDASVIGLQLSLMVKGKRVVDIAEGCGGFDSELRISPTSLFPLLDLSQLMPALALVLLVDRGFLSLSDKISSHLKKFKNEQATVYHLLTHSRVIADSVDPLTYVKALTQRDELREKCFESEAQTGSEGEAQYKVFTFAVIAEALAEEVLKTQTLREFVESELLGVAEDEVILSAEDRKCLSASNQFAPMLRQLLMSASEGGEAIPAVPPTQPVEQAEPKIEAPVSPISSPEQDKGRERERRTLEVTGNAGLAEDESPPSSRLPPGLSIDPLMVNSETLRSSFIPSYGAFATSRGLSVVVDDFLRRKVSKVFLRQLVEASPGTHQEHMVFGCMDWIPGFQVFDAERLDVSKSKSPEISINGTRLESARKVRLLARFGFGGSFVLACPERDFVLSLTVNHLTLQREAAKQVIAEVLDHFKLNINTDLLSGVF